jgi:site-specific recombinase XerD
MAFTIKTPRGGSHLLSVSPMSLSTWLRHSAASLLLALNIHPRVVMELLGHSQISLTMDTYSHTVPEILRDAVDKLGAALDG